eukprot:NODE_3487_length_968_cov_24.314472_g3201_i0.p1 GENE.NODE_3487_length_968_cov_24.314472_g3201_i0~~NODE_3487_length_968_cov_24.314472_g3201_i0.p1  ORF type:complete len:138 (-),score=27.52 NODE_3487_length_968_cov_24.314472_g3201_i0:449-862(-)
MARWSSSKTQHRALDKKKIFESNLSSNRWMRGFEADGLNANARATGSKKDIKAIQQHYLNDRAVIDQLYAKDAALKERKADAPEKVLKQRGFSAVAIHSERAGLAAYLNLHSRGPTPLVAFCLPKVTTVQKGYAFAV